jgi:hypothetical protein
MPIRFTHTNRLMDECLREIEDYWAQEEARLAALQASRECEGWKDTDESETDERTAVRMHVPTLTNLMLCNIVRHKGCDLLRRWRESWDADPDGQFGPTERFPNRSEYEDFENHFHVGDCFISEEPGIHFLIMGLALAEVIYVKLRLSYPDVHFRIPMSFSVKPFEFDPEDIHIRDDCVVRFHAIREGENLYVPPEEYLHEAVGVLEF